MTSSLPSPPAQKSTSFEDAISAPDFASEDYCGTSYAAKLLGLSVATVQAMVEKGEIEAWKTLGGHRRIALRSIETYFEKNNRRMSKVEIVSNRLRVLIVEDDEAMRELYHIHFGEWDLPVDCTWMPSALEALMDIASMKPDLLITDLSMSGVDGIEMLKVLQKNAQLADMQILVISGMPQEAIEARGGLPQYARLLGKPVNFEWLKGYVTALTVVNAKLRDRERSFKRGSRSIPAEPTGTGGSESGVRYAKK